MTQLTEMSAADWQQWRATMAQWMGGVSLWSTRQGALDAERLHHAQLVATLAGERDVALRRVAELEATVAGMEARVKEHENDKAFYMGLFVDSQKGGQQ
jgi:hypothetical protein